MFDTNEAMELFRERVRGDKRFYKYDLWTLEGHHFDKRMVYEPPSR